MFNNLNSLNLIFLLDRYLFNEQFDTLFVFLWFLIILLCILQRWSQFAYGIWREQKFVLKILEKYSKRPFSPGSWCDPGLKSYFGAPPGCQATKSLFSRAVAWPGTKGSFSPGTEWAHQNNSLVPGQATTRD